ncbi:MAG: dsDNA nuclease domain-containing protein [Lachnospiraceae bacterium]|nr:dsDNA nuclease domain-containing protein [Lachnospiraceae bacterium]
MARGNDAIPTWSGFNYQGKIMLLYIINLMNQAAADKDKREYSVELEKTEDFCILCDRKYISFHQVKAWLSTNKWRSYIDAMDKLLKHRNDCNVLNAKCYLVTAKEIKDWNDTANTYSPEIEPYKYQSNVVSVCDVGKFIVEEIKTYLNNKGHAAAHAEIVYGELCLYLDDLIAAMHKKGAKNRCYTILFSEIAGKMEEAVNKTTVREEFYLKEKVYEYIMGNIERVFGEFCQDECGMVLTDCGKKCAAKEAHDKMMEISDYTNFCKILNPSKIDGWNNALTMAANFPEDKLQSEIYELLYQSKSPKKVSGDENSIYLESKFSKSPNGRIMPTFLDLSRVNGKEEALQRKFQNIIKNTDISHLLEGNSITVIPGNYMGKLSQAKITSGWQKSNPEKGSEEKNNPEESISHYYRDIELISSEELRQYFEKNGGNQ